MAFTSRPTRRWRVCARAWSRLRTAVKASPRNRRAAAAAVVVWRGRGRHWRWSSRGRGRPRNGAAATPVRPRAPIPTPSCATSPASARISSTARRSPSTRRARCVVACLGETADGHEGDALAPIIHRARFACPELESVGADQGFAGEQVWKDVAALGVIAYVPPQRTMLPPAGQQPKTDAKREALAARRRCKTPTGIWAHIRRMSDAEGGVAELKNEHAMARARCRGTKLFHVQLLLGCAALNVKRLATRPDAASGQAAGPARAHAAEEAAGTAIGATGRVPSDRSNAPTGSPSSALLTAAAWTISLSMN